MRPSPASTKKPGGKNGSRLIAHSQYQISAMAIATQNMTA